MSFSCLPPELVHQIIHSTVPHTFHSTTYNERQDILCRLSLVSRQFRSIAQPLLLDIAWIDHNDELKLILGDGAGVVTRQLILYIAKDLHPKSISKLAQCAQKLRSLTVTEQVDRVVHLDDLSLCKNLVNLQLSGDSFKATELLQLSSLKQLSVNWQTVKAVPQILDPRTVPALRILGLIVVIDLDDWENLQKTSVLKLLPQLEAVQLRLDLVEFIHGTLFSKLAPPILFDTSIQELQGPANVHLVSTIQHLRLSVRVYLRRHGKSVTFDAISRCVESSQQSKPPRLRSIYLDTDVKPARYDAEEVHEGFGNLAKKCREAGIDLVFEMSGDDYDFDSYISPEFCRRQRKSKEGKERAGR